MNFKKCFWYFQNYIGSVLVVLLVLGVVIALINILSLLNPILIAVCLFAIPVTFILNDMRKQWEFNRWRNKKNQEEWEEIKQRLNEP
jgi:hypothetical protein